MTTASPAGRFKNANPAVANAAARLANFPAFPLQPGQLPKGWHDEAQHVCGIAESLLGHTGRADLHAHFCGLERAVRHLHGNPEGGPNHDAAAHAGYALAALCRDPKTGDPLPWLDVTGGLTADDRWLDCEIDSGHYAGYPGVTVRAGRSLECLWRAGVCVLARVPTWVFKCPETLARLSCEPVILAEPVRSGPFRGCRGEYHMVREATRYANRAPDHGVFPGYLYDAMAGPEASPGVRTYDSAAEARADLRQACVRCIEDTRRAIR